MSNSVGRPLTTIADLAENWRDIMHTIYADGGSDAEVKVALAIPPSRAISNMLWDDLQAREPEFSEAIREGRILAEMWWQRKGREGLFTYEGVKFSSQLWFINMKNRFGWKDKQEVEHSADKDAPPVFTLKIDNS
ncbi:hypothetical protein [Rhizobium leguminosarum]|uniref:hypothetical protein n=1 Tax=Rhizobium leguminosarum TaxID=384 RepID=UPI0012FA4B15|nr:hypothetical protein [Rhizobium leguminosarum]